MKFGTSPSSLDKNKLKSFHDELEITKTDFIVESLEYLIVETKSGISLKIYEDGLVTLKKPIETLDNNQAELQNYFEQRFSPAISYLFSLGAPVPKELAGIETVYPFFIVTEGAKAEDLKKLLSELGSTEEDYELISEGIEIYRGKQYFLINGHKKFEHLDQLIEMLIFFKEFKSQLHHYLNLHRIIWEKIAHIRERKAIVGKDVQDLRNQLESYRKTIELIDGRMSQMPLYMNARERMIGELHWEQFLTQVLQYKYNNLRDTLQYVQAQWRMTRQYVDSAVEVFNGINAQTTKNSINALTVITSIGVVNSLISYMTMKQYPSFTTVGLYYLGLLILVTWLVNQLVTFAFRILEYKINDIKLAKNIAKDK